MAATIDKIGRVTSVSVKKGTAKTWDQWVKILTQAGAKGWTHQEIVAHLQKKYKLGPWWRQGVALGFEIHTGKRIEGQSLKGDYSTVATRMVGGAAKSVWKFMWSEEGLGLWLEPMSHFKPRKGEVYEVEGGIYGEVRTVKPFESVRMTWRETEWPKNSILHMHVLARGKEKCMVVVAHGGLKTAALREQMRAHWKIKLDKIRDHFSDQAD